MIPRRPRRSPIGRDDILPVVTDRRGHGYTRSRSVEPMPFA
jgi:hypothetical protein